MKLSSIPRLLTIVALLTLARPAVAQQPAPDAAARIKGLFETANKYFRERAYDKARAEYAKILALPGVNTAQVVDARKRTADTWMRQRAYDKAHAEYVKILALPDLHMTYRVDTLKRTAYAWTREKAYDRARAEYAKILALPDLHINYRVDAVSRTGDTWMQEGALGKARAEYAKILAIPDLGVSQQIDAYCRMADAWNAEGQAAEARKICEAMLKRPDLPRNQRRAVLEPIAGSYVAEGDIVKLRETLASMAPLYPSWTWRYSSLHNKLAELAAKALTARDFSAALTGYLWLARCGKLDVRRRHSALTGVVKARAGTKDAARRGEATRVAEQALRALAGQAKASAQDRLRYRIQLAAIPGLDGDFQGLGKALDEVLKPAEGISKPELLGIVQNANILFMAAREYGVAKILKARADALLEAGRAPNVYTCRFIPDPPKGAGAWAQSEFVKDARNASARFFAYPRKEEEKLIADMGAERPLAEKDPDVAKGRETAVYMAYDTHGWHLFIRSDDPDIAQIMREDGRRGSSLEMFFAPGLKAEVYYQWIINLAQAKTDLYHWNTPHRSYRYLEDKVGSFRTETAVLKTGWGTSVFITWAALYDKLPFFEGNENVWRFSTMRWGPVNLTWGGAVHEPGRWGLVKWEPPTPQQLLEIQRHIVRKAWWRYESGKGRLSEFWRSARGDQAFYDEALAPFFARQDAFEAQMEQVAQWDAETVAQIFSEQVPLWMELDYLVEEWRADFLLRRMLAE